MGMFDEVTVPTKLLPKPLPKYFANKSEHTFQTKNLDCLMDVYEISLIKGKFKKNYGLFLKERPWIDSDFGLDKTLTARQIEYHGEISLSDSNMCAGCSLNGKYQHYTTDGSDFEEIDYIATFTHGKLEKIVEECRVTGPARESKFFRSDCEEENAKREQKIRERAYQIYEKRKEYEGDELSDWRKAKKQIQDEEWIEWERMNKPPLEEK